jgi:hypothetical protein
VRGLLSAVRKTNAFGVVLGCVNNAISFAPANTHEALSRSNTYRSRPKRLCRCFSSARDSCTEASGASVGVKRTGCGVVVENSVHLWWARGVAMGMRGRGLEAGDDGWVKRQAAHVRTAVVACGRLTGSVPVGREQPGEASAVAAAEKKANTADSRCAPHRSL